MSGVVLVTGAGRGIGAAIAKVAAKKGYEVAVNYSRSAEAAKRVVTDIERAGGTAVALAGDVSVEADVMKLFAAVDRLGPLAALVNNAGIMKPTPIASANPEIIAEMMRVNVAGVFMCIREAVKRMSTTSGGKGGSIVNISSMAAKLGGLPGYIAYGASKGAVDTLTVGLAREVAQQGIRINAVRPGLTRTDMIDQAGGTAAVEQMAKAAVPMGRLGEPEEIAELVLWLLSPEASYVTGALYDVSGGR